MNVTANGTAEMNTDGVIKTSLKDQVVGADDERGARAWRSAELVAEEWFLVERCTNCGGEMQLRRWISTSIQECGRLLGAAGAQWSRLMAYVRVPQSTGTGFMFGEVADIHELPSDGTRVLRFTNGMTLVLGGGTMKNGSFAAELLIPVYSKSPFSWAQQHEGLSMVEQSV